MNVSPLCHSFTYEPQEVETLRHFEGVVVHCDGYTKSCKVGDILGGSSTTE